MPTGFHCVMIISYIDLYILIIPMLSICRTTDQAFECFQINKKFFGIMSRKEIKTRAQKHVHHRLYFFPTPYICRSSKLM